MEDLVWVLPTNWQVIFAELAYDFGWTPPTIDALTLRDLLWWHQAVVKKEKK